MQNQALAETADTSPASPVFTVLPLVTLTRPSAAEFDREAATHKPFLIKGVADDWKAVREWTPDYLKAKAGQAQVPVLKVAEGGPEGRFFYGDNPADTVSFGDCLPLLEGAASRVYMAGVPVAEHLPMLGEELAPLDFLAAKRQKKRQLWISGRNSKGPMHFDLDDNIHVVLSGRKRFILFDYAQRQHLYPAPALSDTPHYSRVDAEAPDVAKFPDIRRAQGYDVTLGPGDMVYIPQGCWHQVVTEAPALALNYWIGMRFLEPAMWRIIVNLGYRFVRDLLRPLRALGRSQPAGAATR